MSTFCAAGRKPDRGDHPVYSLTWLPSGGYTKTMVQVGLKDAKNRLSELFTRALHGENVVITRQGEAQSIRLTPVPTPQAAKGFGMLREQLRDLPPDWNSPEAEAEFLQQFEALRE